MRRSMDGMKPRFVLHDHRQPRPHFDLRLEEGGVLRSWAVPKGLPDDPAHDRLAVSVDDHALDHLDFEDEHKTIADDGTWEEHDRNARRIVFLAARTFRRAPVRPDPHGAGALVAAPHEGPA